MESLGEPVVELKKKISGTDHMVAGAVGGIAGVIAGHPLDTLKTRLQAPETPFKTPMQVLRFTFQEEGLRGFYRGITPPLSTVAISNSLTFFVYGNAKGLLPQHWSEFQKGIVAGSLSGIVTTTVITPRDLVKSRLQLSPCRDAYMNSPLTSTECLKRIWKEEGLRGLYRGGLTSVIRDIPGNAAYFAMYEGMKHLLTPNGQSSPSTLSLIFSGGSAGVAYWTSIYPLDTIRTAIQVQEGPVRYKGMIDCAKSILREQGMKGFYRGYVLCLMRSFPISAVNFVIYEATLKFLTDKKVK